MSIGLGRGHQRAAEALCSQAKQSFGQQLELTHLDVLDLVHPAWRGFTTGMYRWFSSPTGRPFWRRGYDATDRPGLPVGLNRLAFVGEQLQFRRLRAWLQRQQPDAIICTHFMPMIHLGIEEGPLAFLPRFTVITDHIAHGLWLQPGCDGYFTADDDVAEQVRQACPQTAVHSSGIPCDPSFTPEPLALGGPFRLLAVIGSGGMAPRASHVAAALSRNSDCQVCCVVPRRGQAGAQLQALQQRYPQRLKLLRQQRDLAPLIAASDAVMAKAGGLITTETLAVGRPLILVEPIPGQEEANSRWLTGAGAAIRADAPEAVGEAVTRLMGQRALAAARAQRLGRPDAAHNVLSTVLRALGQHSRAVDRHAA